MTNNTIYALSTVNGKSGVAVIRISGSNAINAIKKMTDIETKTISPRKAYFCNIFDLQKNLLDKALILYFKAPNSFTGEDIVEFQVHGSKAVISSVLDCLSSLDDFRLAEAGEFSKRAFYNNKMDLTEAEGLADLIDAETSEQQKYALRQIEGNLKCLYEGWREELLKIMSHIEAYIDFPDEELPDDIIDNMQNTVFKIKEDVNNHLLGSNIGERLRDGFRVAIIGEPNSGKSSLVNSIVGREAVIVSDIAGTTRDAIDIHLNVRGYPIIITDTAGLRNTDETIEKKGIEIAYKKANEADFVICLFDAQKEITSEFSNISKNKSIFVANKCDKISKDDIKKLNEKGIITISAKNNQGIDNIFNLIADKISDEFSSSSGFLITRQRYREALKNTVNCLEKFSFDKEIELSAEDLRLACREIGKITGRIEVDEILDKIFGSFCIGK